MDIEHSYKESTRWLLPLFLASLLGIGVWIFISAMRSEGDRPEQGVAEVSR